VGQGGADCMRVHIREAYNRYIHEVGACKHSNGVEQTGE
jgi:hypothetical protein